jgi:hypothetical protein
MRTILLPLPAGESVLIGAVVAVLVLVPLLSVPAEHFSAMAHEGTRALAAFILGLTVTEIIIDRASGSRTSIAGEGLRVTLAVLIGYLGPSLFGMGAALLISRGAPLSVLWLLVVALVLMLFLLGRSFGCLSVPIAIVLLYAVLHYERSRTEVIAAYVIAWLLLVSGVRAALGHVINSADRETTGGDVRVPGMMVALIWLAGALAALAVGGKLLVLG